MFNPMNFMAMLGQFYQFAQNPAVGLQQKGYNIPENLRNNPRGMVNYLRNSGQMTDQMFGQFQQDAEQFKNMMPRNY